MQAINQVELIRVLASVKTAQAITLTAFVDARCKKTGNPFKQVHKLSRVNGFTAFDYESSVNRQQVREGAPEGDFEAKQRQWGTRVSPCLIDHNGQAYLVLKVQWASKPLYFARTVSYWKLVDKSLVAPFLPAHKSQADNQGVDKEIVYRNYAIRNLRSVSIMGEVYKVNNAQ